MSAYIKREDAIGYIKHVYHESVKFYEVDEEEVIDSLVEALNALPSADVEPVRHGVWREYGENNDNTHNIGCSICGHKIKSKGHANSIYTKSKYRYCPYCGARMDGEEE